MLPKKDIRIAFKRDIKIGAEVRQNISATPNQSNVSSASTYVENTKATSLYLIIGLGIAGALALAYITK